MARGLPDRGVAEALQQLSGEAGNPLFGSNPGVFAFYAPPGSRSKRFPGRRAHSRPAQALLRDPGVAPGADRLENGRFRGARYNRAARPEDAQPIPGGRPPETSHIFTALLQLRLRPEDAYAFVEEMQSMASANLIARFESKLDALAATQSAEVSRLESKLDAQMEALRSELRATRWVIGGVAVLLSLIIAAGQFGSAYGQAAGSPEILPAAGREAPSVTVPDGP